MSQIFCVRREYTLGLAVVKRDGNGLLTLLDLYPRQDSEIEDFPDDLAKLIKQFYVQEIFVSPLGEGEGYVGDLSEFAALPESESDDDQGIMLSQMPRLVRPVEGRIARASQTKAGLIDETHYEQQTKLAARIERSSKGSEIGADVEAYLCAVVLAQSDFSGEVFLGDSAESEIPFYEEYGSGSLRHMFG